MAGPNLQLSNFPHRGSVFGKLGWIMVRRSRVVVGIWVFSIALSIPFLLRVEEPLKVGGFSSPRTEAARARAVMQAELGASASQLVVVFESTDSAISTPANLDLIEAAVAGFAGQVNVVDVILPSSNASLISPDDRTAYVLIGLDLSAEEAQRLVEDYEKLIVPQAGLAITLAGGPAFYADIETVSQRDLQRAEMIALPFALIALLLVFGTVVAALVPLIVGGFGVAAILLTIYGLAHSTDLSIFVLNLATMLGLGLAIDYSLFITSRFREELNRSDSIDQAIETTMETAGRAIFFSGLTVLIGLSGLILFDFMFLRSVGIAGVIVVFFSVTAALTLLPALLSIVGRRIESLAILRFPEAESASHGFWATLSRRVMQRPFFVLIPTLVLLLAFGSPFRHVNISSPDATILPTSTESRQGYDQLVAAFGPGEISPLVIIYQSPTSVFSKENVVAIHRLAAELHSDPRVSRVEGFASLNETVTDDQAYTLVRLQRRAAELGIGERFNQFANETTAMLLVYSTSFPNSDLSKELLKEIRSRPPGGDLKVLVDGGTAEIVDVVEEMYASFPLAIGLVLLATYVVLFLLFRSVFLPLKAILMNTLSLLASYGALVWVFQDGHFDNLLRFEALGYVEASLPIIMFCVLFGLSMDYEVFLLTRVREEWLRTGNNTESVAAGLQRSGRIITSAALIVVVVTTSFVSADVILVKALGFGIALAVLIDATIVRALLVPATMRLLGNWNWWAPGFVDRIIPELGEGKHD